MASWVGRMGSLCLRLLLIPLVSVFFWAADWFYPLWILWRTKKWIRKDDWIDLRGVNPYGRHRWAKSFEDFDDDFERNCLTFSIWSDLENNALQFDQSLRILGEGFRSRTLKWRITTYYAAKFYQLLASVPSNEPRFTEFLRQASERFKVLEPNGATNPSVTRMFLTPVKDVKASEVEEEKSGWRNEMETQLFVRHALDEKNLHQLDDWLDEGGSVDATDQYGQSFMIHAAQNRQPLVIETLILRGADVDQRDNLGHTPLTHAIRKNYSDMVDFLLRFKPDLEVRESVLHRTPLLISVYAGSEEIFESLLRAGADPNAVDRLGMTPLILAISLGRRGMARRLIEEGVDLDHQDIIGNTALIEAYVRKDLETARALVAAGADQSVCNREGQSGQTLSREGDPGED
ncbi:MAG: ankyrin repeat domain-containing protein [Candidatus Omnitrophica bacterium]|nr:ankyrin repeat domain-containing protein [Candidatus Omnitrophota bacterium]